MSGPEMLQPEGLGRPVGMYSHVSRAGDLLFIAGQLAVDVDGNIVGPGDFEAQMRQVFRNLEAALSGGGTSFDGVAKFTTYLTRAADIEDFYRVRSELFSELFPEGGYPPNTLLVVDRLVFPECVIEVEAVAAV